MESISATGTKTSSKLIPSSWTKPLAIRHALCLAMELRSSRYTLKTHLSPIGRHPSGRPTSSDVSLSSIAFIFSSIACRQC